MTTDPLAHPGAHSLALVETCESDRLGDTFTDAYVVIMRVIRVYAAAQQERADEDLELARLVDPGAVFDLQEVPIVEH